MKLGFVALPERAPQKKKRGQILQIACADFICEVWKWQYKKKPKISNLILWSKSLMSVKNRKYQFSIGKGFQEKIKIKNKQHSSRFWRPWHTEPSSADEIKQWRASHLLKGKCFLIFWQLNMLNKPTVSKRRRYWQVKFRIKQTNKLSDQQRQREHQDRPSGEELERQKTTYFLCYSCPSGTLSLCADVEM